MGGLSEREVQDFAVTIAALLAGRCDGQQAVATTVAQVEQIVARHVAAALTEAADAIRDARPGPDRDDEPGNWKRGERHGRIAAARIVRDRIPPP